MKKVRIYCEGKVGSHDYDILNKVLGDLRPNIDIKPLGGKFGAKAIMDFYENANGSAAKSDFYLWFRDRDFDYPVSDVAGLTKDKHIYSSYRTTIENYLLDTSVFWQYAVENNIYGLQTIEEVEGLFYKSAMDILEYQAVRHALGKMHCGVSFKTRWTGKDGDLPQFLDLENCESEGWNLICQAKNETNDWTESGYQAEVQSFLALFDDGFMKAGDYLVWFQGKDFASALCRNRPDFPMNDYYKFAKSVFDYTKFADLCELRKLVEDNI